MSNKHPNLTNPPAMEVVFGITLEQENCDVQSFEISDEEFLKKFTGREETLTLEANFDAKKGGGVTNSKVTGLVFKNKSEDEIAQFHQNEVTYNKIGNYLGGSDFISNATAAISPYFKTRDNCRVKYYGLRYINLISIKNFNNNYDDYFNIYLKEEEPSYPFKKYRYLYIKNIEGCTCLVNFSLDSVNSDNEAKFILDIDILNKSVPSKWNKKDFEDQFEKMRFCKNEIFFSTLKTKVLEQYE